MLHIKALPDTHDNLLEYRLLQKNHYNVEMRGQFANADCKVEQIVRPNQKN